MDLGQQLGPCQHLRTQRRQCDDQRDPAGDDCDTARADAGHRHADRPGFRRRRRVQRQFRWQDRRGGVRLRHRGRHHLRLVAGRNFSQSVLAVDNSNHGTGAVYKGLAVANVGGSTNHLFAANFRSGQIEVYDQNFNLVSHFTDPTLPAGYAPFNVQVLNGKLYVTFAQQDAAKHDDVAGPGHGFVDSFNLDGSGMQRLISGGKLNSPWGLAIAPSTMGAFAGDLLVGNFGNGTINIFDKTTNDFLGALKDLKGGVIRIGDLWDITIGNGGMAGDPGTLYFTAGVLQEAHGLFGSLTPSIVTAMPEPGSLVLLLGGIGTLGWWRRRKNGRTVPA